MLESGREREREKGVGEGGKEEKNNSQSKLFALYCGLRGEREQCGRTRGEEETASTLLFCSDATQKQVNTFLER